MGRLRGDGGVDGHPMPHGELHHVAVEQAHRRVFRLQAADVLMGGPLHENGGQIGGGYGQAGLENPGQIFALYRLFLVVDQEEGQAPGSVAAAAAAAHLHAALLLRFERPGAKLPFLQGEGVAGFDRPPLPDAFGTAGGGCIFLAFVGAVVAPFGGNGQGLGAVAGGEGEADG